MVSEVVHSGAAELVHSGEKEFVSVPNCPMPSTEGFEVFPLTEEKKPRKQRSDKGVPRGPHQKSVKVKRKSVKVTERGPGRPRVYNGTQRRIVAAALKHYGYTKGLEFLHKERGLSVSKTLARSVAKEVGLTFKRGRPAA